VRLFIRWSYRGKKEGTTATKQQQHEMIKIFEKKNKAKRQQRRAIDPYN
jgi:hypothetical protein